MQVKAVLFDMDGVVLDTEKLYTRFWQEAAGEFGYEMTLGQTLGMRSLNRKAGEAKLKSYFGDNISYEQIREKRIELMDAFVEKEGVLLKEGINQLLDYLKENDIKTAIATSSPIERTIKYLSSVKLVDRFDDIISGYMVENGKPAPDIFLYAAEKLGEQPKECLVLEDSPAGIMAAYNAGCIPVMVPDQDKPGEDIKKLLYCEAENLIKVIDILEELK